MDIRAVLRLIFFIWFISCVNAYSFNVSSNIEGDFVSELKSKVSPKKCEVAVSYIYDADTYNLTLYGNLIRDNLETFLTKNGFDVAPRKDIAILLEDMSAENMDIFDLKAGVLLLGCYYRFFLKNDYKIRLVLKAYYIKDKKIILVKSYKKRLSTQELEMFAKVKGNIKRQKIGAVSNLVTLNKNCFNRGDKAYIRIKTSPGKYIYLFNIAADGSVTRIYPTSFFNKNPISGNFFEFPPRDTRDFSVQMYPLPAQPISYESFVVVWSNGPVNTKNFKVPEGKIISGKEATPSQRLYKLLNKSQLEFQEIPYVIKNTKRCY